MMITILRFRPSFWRNIHFFLDLASFLAYQENNFQKTNCPKWTLHSDFVKLGSKILYLFQNEVKKVLDWRILLLKSMFF